MFSTYVYVCMYTHLIYNVEQCWFLLKNDNFPLSIFEKQSDFPFVQRHNLLSIFLTFFSASVILVYNQILSCLTEECRPSWRAYKKLTSIRQSLLTHERPQALQITCPESAKEVTWIYDAL